jgi:hypothetical protein
VFRPTIVSEIVKQVNHRNLLRGLHRRGHSTNFVPSRTCGQRTDVVSSLVMIDRLAAVYLRGFARFCNETTSVASALP